MKWDGQESCEGNTVLPTLQVTFIVYDNHVLAISKSCSWLGNTTGFYTNTSTKLSYHEQMWNMQ